jgi:hypothetical protein
MHLPPCRGVDFAQEHLFPRSGYAASDGRPGRWPYLRQGPWRGVDAVGFPTLEWVNWPSNRRRMESIGNVGSTDLETGYCQQLTGTATAT